MKDLRVSYTKYDGERANVEYSTIMDFMDEVEENMDNPIMECKDVEADFFENPLRHQHFNLK